MPYNKKEQDISTGDNESKTTQGFTKLKKSSTNPTTQSVQRKQKHPRINMAFYDDNLDYVREAAYQSRMSVTEYVNKLIVEDRQRTNVEPLKP